MARANCAVPPVWSRLRHAEDRDFGRAMIGVNAPPMPPRLDMESSRPALSAGPSLPRALAGELAISFAICKTLLVGVLQHRHDEPAGVSAAKPMLK